MAVNPPPLVCMKAFDWVESLCELCQSLLTQDPANANAYHDLIRVRARPDHGWAPKLVEILSDRVPYDKTRQTFMGMVECIRFDSEMDNLVQQLFRSVQCGFNPCKYDGHEPDPDSDEQVAGEAAWMAIREGLHLARALLQQFPARFMFCGIDTEDMRVRSNWFASAGGSTETPG
ncbi:MAG TPA: hypothetical protein VM597_04795, partial [Gemmataceae bacterium]|nr:hypothetical protein [Gemmataceae bacterium]